MSWHGYPCIGDHDCVYCSYNLRQLVTMGRSVVAPSWLSATIRTLEKRVQALEQKPFSFNAKAPDYFPQLPPSLHHPVSENFDFACLFHDLYYNVAAGPEILPAEGFDSQDIPLLDNFIQRSKNLSVDVSDGKDVPLPDNVIQRSKNMPQDNDGEQCAYGDVKFSR